MSRRECPLTNEACKYYEMPPPPELAATQEHGCFSDVDHKVSRRLAYDSLSRYFINRPENKEQICREQHDFKNYTEQTTGVDINPLPDDEFLRQTALADIEAGRQVPRSVRKKLSTDREQVAQRRAETMSQFWGSMQERQA